MPMCGREMIVELLNSYYGSTSLLNYSESEDEIQFQLPAPITDRQTASFRSQATVLNELAISHRLSLLLGRTKFGLPEDFSFAITSLESFVQSIDAVDGYDLSLHFEVLAKRRDVITGLKSNLVTKYGVESRTTTTSFNVLPPALTNFVRRQRGFMDFSEVKIGGDKSHLENVADNQFRYYPSEEDRLSDGKRVDHVPALTLIDIALWIDNKGAAYSRVSAEFLNYTDPRLTLEIERKDQNAVEFLQNGKSVAVVHL